MTAGQDFAEDDLEFVVRVTGHRRYRELLDPGHRDYNPDYWALIKAEAVRLKARWGEPEEEPKGEEPSLPSLVQMVPGLVDTAVRSAFAAIRGWEVLLSEEDYRARLDVCTRSESLSIDQIVDGHCDHYRPSDGRCGGMDGCGCFLADHAGIPGKARIATSDCPLGRWPKTDEKT